MFRHMHSLRNKLMLTVLLLLAAAMAIVILIAQTRSQSVIREQSLSLHTKLVKTGAERLDTSCMRLDDIYRSIYLFKKPRPGCHGGGKAQRYRAAEKYFPVQPQQPL